MYFVRLRRNLRHASGVIFASSLLLFVLSLLYISLSSRLPQESHGSSYKSFENEENTQMEQNNISPKSERDEFLLKASWTVVGSSTERGPTTRGGGPSTESILQKLVVGDPERAMESIQFLNRNHEVLNIEKFGALISENVRYVIVVQVHERIEYLKYLIGSLSRARGIDKVLLVFSHDLISAPINNLIQSINFCRVIQLFFPYSVQLFPNIYPGQNPKECPASMKKEKAKETNCIGAEFPDVGGHYRNPKLAQIKHHWWWKINFLFDGVLTAYGLEEKLLLLLEEDHLVAPDFLHVLSLMEERRSNVCPGCELLCLGTYPKNYLAYGTDISNLGADIWYSSKYNMGLAIGKSIWEQIRSENCSRFFCDYDDYNWDWTLLQLSVKCLPTKMRVIYTKAPRVIHIGDCGVHTHKCNADTAVHDALKLFDQHNASFFPAQLSVGNVGKRMLKPSKPNGGWADPRDHRLCSLNTHPTSLAPAEVLNEARRALQKEEADENGGGPKKGEEGRERGGGKEEGKKVEKGVVGVEPKNGEAAATIAETFKNAQSKVGNEI